MHVFRAPRIEQALKLGLPPLIAVAALFKFYEREIAVHPTYIILIGSLTASVVFIRNTTLRIILIVCVSSVSALVLFDIYHFTFQGSGNVTRKPATYTPNISRADPNLGVVAAPNQTYLARRIGKDESDIIYQAHYTIGDLGFRKTVGNPAGRSVVFLGDSFTFGEGLEDDKTFPQVFSDLTNHRFKVLNFGFPGYGPQQALGIAEFGLFEPQIGPDPIVFVLKTAAWHADRVTCVPTFTRGAPRYEFADGGELKFLGACSGSPFYRVSWLAEGSPALQRLVGLFDDRVAGARKFRLYLAVLEQLKQAIEQRYRSRLVVFYLRSPPETFLNTSYSDDRLLGALRSRNIDLIDDAMTGLPSDPNQFSIPRDGHPNALAQRMRAQALHRWLLGRGILGAATGSLN